MVDKIVDFEGLSFDDLLILPSYSDIQTRREIDLSVKIGNLKLRIPVISAPMDTVTGSSLAISMAEMGGLGVIHRFQSIDSQVEEVKKVKRFKNVIIRDPITVRKTDTLQTLHELELRFGVHSFPVIDNDSKLAGIVTRSDYSLENDKTILVSSIMTSLKETKILVVDSVDNLELQNAIEFIKRNKIKILPIVNPSMELLGLITRKDILRLSDTNCATDSKGQLLVGAATGIRHDWLERAVELVSAGADLICIDVANGYLTQVIKCVETLKSRFPNICLMVGNVATQEGYTNLEKAGADAIKVGIGPGSVCTTRIVTGIGVPQATAIYMCSKVKTTSSLIADGGCKNFGDIAKALALGGDTVMLGSMLAGTEESLGDMLIVSGRRVKSVRGMASSFAFRDKIERSGDQPEYEPVSEGVNVGFVDFKGSVKEVLLNIEKALKSAFSYVGARNFTEFQAKTRLIRISENALKESNPHSIFNLA
ncbi:MAG: IMP dehydrogenase [Deltaproteobacteria bacterium]|nr:IMP dehydrogenase [Deltaproteobacteria bacterium]